MLFLLCLIAIPNPFTVNEKAAYRITYTLPILAGNLTDLRCCSAFLATPQRPAITRDGIRAVCLPFYLLDRVSWKFSSSTGYCMNCSAVGCFQIIVPQHHTGSLFLFQ
jgi:hypothetical protein